MYSSDWFLEPFPHRFGTGFFSEDLYQAMLESLPGIESRMVPADPATSKFYPENLRRKEPLRFRLDALSADPFWKGIYKLIRDQYPDGKSTALLYHTLPGFDLLVHTDFPGKVETTVYYLTDKEVPGVGTAMFIPKCVGFVCPNGTNHYFQRQFYLAKISPFVPNGYMKFQRSNKSFHGVLPCPVHRWAIYYTKYDMKEGAWNVSEE
jgi:hypothetical protein